MTFCSNPATKLISTPKLDSTVDLFEKTKLMIEAYWQKYPDLHQIVQLHKQNILAANDSEPTAVETKELPEEDASDNSKDAAFINFELRGRALRDAIRKSHQNIREKHFDLQASIIPRTQAQNTKCSRTTLLEEQAYRGDLIGGQIQAWRSMLPKLIKQFAKVKDYRRAGSIKHKTTVLMMFGLFSFVFKMQSRREINRELTGPVIFEHLKKLFPEIDSIPHADTLARFLKNTNPKEIEKIHINLIKDLILKKKFKKLLINECLPITVDGTQKLFREGLLREEMWCERKIGTKDEKDKQQYIYAIEANITLKNGLNIPLMTEYLSRNNNQLEDSTDKQDSETTAFERLAQRLKKYFPRLNIIIFADAMYATQHVMEILNQNHWEFIIRLPKRKLTDFAKRLNKNKFMSRAIPGQSAYRNRNQTFHWVNGINYGYKWELNIHLASCLEEYYKVDNKAGEIIKCYSEHCWISSIPVNINNAHELFNLGARKKELIEDSMNTEKNRGYCYKHAFSYDWNTLQGFHHLMRLAHAINALSEFTKCLKTYVKSLGSSATLKLIKETLFSPWFSNDFYDAQLLKIPQLRFQFE